MALPRGPLVRNFVEVRALSAVARDQAPFQPHAPCTIMRKTAGRKSAPRPAPPPPRHPCRKHACSEGSSSPGCDQEASRRPAGESPRTRSDWPFQVRLVPRRGNEAEGLLPLRRQEPVRLQLHPRRLGPAEGFEGTPSAAGPFVLRLRQTGAAAVGALRRPGLLRRVGVRGIQPLSSRQPRSRLGLRFRPARRPGEREGVRTLRSDQARTDPVTEKKFVLRRRRQHAFCRRRKISICMAMILTLFERRQFA